MDCTFRLSLTELISRPAAELRLVGADGDGDNNSGGSGDQGNENGGAGNDQDGDGGNSGSGDGDKGKQSSADPKDRKIASLEDEKQRHYDLRKEAEDKLKDANDRIAKLEKDGTTDDETRQKLASQERTIADQEVIIGDLRLENAFLKSNKFKWRSAGAALKLADLSKVRIDEKTGDVFGLDDALKALAEESPFLLLEEDKDDADKDKPKPKKTGTAPAGNTGNDDKSKQATDARLRSKYAGLRR